MAASPFYIEIEKLRYAYARPSGRQVLGDVDLYLRPDEYVLLCGASGSGKSTLVRTLNGLIPHFYGGTLHGHVRIAGTSTRNSTVGALFEKIGMVFQNPEVQLFNRTVAREIAFGLESLGLPRSEMRRRLDQTADLCGITSLLDRNPHRLSGGEQELVALAAILAARPQVIVLDEPYANLDPHNVRRIRALLQSLHRQGIGIVISEHRLVPTVPDVERMVVLSEGHIALNAPPRDLFEQDMEKYGLETPLAVKIARQKRLRPLPLDMSALQSQWPSNAAFEYRWPTTVGPKPISRTEVLLEAEALSHHVDGTPVLKAISFALRRGECLAIVGPNGAGKTTLIKHMNGLYRPTTGRLWLKGDDTRRRKVSHLARHVGVAFQNPNSQFFKLTVQDEIQVGARALDCFDADWLENLVRLFRLQNVLTRAPYRLSSGEKKRVAFAAALAAQPDILALDEPTAGQDLSFRRALQALLSELLSGGRAVLLATQDLAFAEQVAHTWLLLVEGRAVAYGPPQHVMAETAAMQQAGLEPTDAFRLQRFGL
jgi:energy-coupling factor transport system ATP-binding protein